MTGERISMKVMVRNSIILLISVILFTGCAKGKGGSQPEAAETKGPDTAEAAEAQGADPVKPAEAVPEDPDGLNRDSGKETGIEEPEKSSEEENEEEEGPWNEGGAEDASGGKSLVERLCGKYRYHLSAEEYYTLDVISFGDNLYAFCGQAMGEGSDSLETYSFWAAEFIPDDPEELKSKDSDSAEVSVFNFSIMSNAGKYWDTGTRGIIRIERGGISFEGFDNDGFLVPEHSDSRLFLSDDRAESVFPYLNNSSADPDLQGYWELTGKEASLYLKFEGSNLYIYRKVPGEEVYYAAGGCDFNDGSLRCRANALGKGGMPDEWKADYRVEGDSLVISIEGETLPSVLEGEVRLKRTKKEDIHVTTLDEMELNGNSLGSNGNWMEQSFDSGFYGVWTAALTDRETAVSEAERLNREGYDSCVCFSPEWDNLNKKEYYCVALGRYGTEDEAEDALKEAKDGGINDAFVKFSGKRKYTTVEYTNFGDVKMENNSDRVVLKNVAYDISRSWRSEIKNEGQLRGDLIIDSDTVFDEKCETEFFGNYEKEDTPLSWFKKNLEYMENDPDKYMSNGPALSGVFEVGINGGHIDRFFGCYWWD